MEELIQTDQVEDGVLNQAFLKNISVLYVEDEEGIRNSILPTFSKIFGSISVATDGQEGLEFFSKHRLENNAFDVIISDLNMPNMTGIEMTEQIRKIDPSIPIIFTTAHSDTEFFLKAINHKIHHYAIKPINIKELALAVQDATMKRYQEKIIRQKELENERYIELINQVALVTKWDLEGNITYANDILLFISGYTRDELIGKSHTVLFHEEVLPRHFETLWATLKSGHHWKGKMKSKTKNNEEYIINTTVFPVYDQFGESICEYMEIQFLITDEEMARRDFHKKVIQNLKEHKLIQSELTAKIEDLEKRLATSGDNSYLLGKLEDEKKKNGRIIGQLGYYERILEETKREFAALQTKALERERKLVEDFQKLKEVIRHLQNEESKNKNALLILHEENKRLGETLTHDRKIIQDLQGIIVTMEATQKSTP